MKQAVGVPGPLLLSYNHTLDHPYSTLVSTKRAAELKPSPSKLRKFPLECYACQNGGFVLIDSKLYKEWLKLEKDQQLSEKEKGDV